MRRHNRFDWSIRHDDASFMCMRGSEAAETRSER